VRAEHVRVAERPDGAGDWFPGEVIERSFLGATTRLYVKAGDCEHVVIADIAGAPPAWAEPSATIHFGWAPSDGLAYSRVDAPDGLGDRLP
jgi:hypothetical protein